LEGFVVAVGWGCCLNPLLSEAGFSTYGAVTFVAAFLFCLNPLLSEAGFSTPHAVFVFAPASVGLNPLLSEAGFSTRRN